MKLTNEVKEAIRIFIINSIENHPNDLIAFVTDHFEISRPTTAKLINELIENSSITKMNKNGGRNPGYELAMQESTIIHKLDQPTKLQEDRIFYNEIMPLLQGIPINVMQIMEYASAEMINNVIDHSEGQTLEILVKRNLKKACIIITDDGIGIFNKIQRNLDLQTPQQSILELCKGKFTSDPKAHTGEGIFFTSRMVDTFNIISYGLFFSGHDGGDFIIERNTVDDVKGTAVVLEMDLHTKRTAKEVFDTYADPDVEPGFFRTCIPVRLMSIEGGQLVSRSQAKRMMSRVDRFLDVILDFESVDMIGQAFADEIFRVFQSSHKDVLIRTINTNESVSKMIRYVLASNQDSQTK
jgi:anti-sigma regulatory factor (Ser/Thr protein kinase)